MEVTESADIDDIDRKVPVVAELIATVSESCARMLVLEHHPWTAADLATYVARIPHPRPGRCSSTVRNS